MSLGLAAVGLVFRPLGKIVRQQAPREYVTAAAPACRVSFLAPSASEEVFVGR